MMRIQELNKTLTLALLISMLGMGSIYAAGIRFTKTDFEEAKRIAKKENKLVFVDVYATWCGPCKYLSKSVFTQDKVGDFFNQNFISIKINGEAGEGPKLMNEFGIDAFPTMLFVSPEGALLKKNVGATGPEDLVKVANAVVHPETTELYQMDQKYKTGNRERSFLVDYANELYEEDRDSMAMVILEMVLDKYPDLDLEDEGEFFMFLLGVNDIESPLMKTYLKDLKKYESQHGAYFVEKFTLVMEEYMAKAHETGNKALLISVFDELVKGFERIGTEVNYEGLKAAILEAYEEGE